MWVNRVKDGEWERGHQMFSQSQLPLELVDFDGDEIYLVLWTGGEETVIGPFEHFGQVSRTLSLRNNLSVRHMDYAYRFVSINLIGETPVIHPASIGINVDDKAYRQAKAKGAIVK